VSELFRVLKPGGSLVITVPAAKYPFGWDPVNWALERGTGRHIAGERMFSGIWYGHLRLYDKPGLTSLLRSAGFEVETTRGLTHYVPPFTHLVMYGMLKPLLMSGKLPGALAGAGDRHAKSAKPGGPVALAAKALNAWDRRNDDPHLDDKVDSFVAIAVHARKPAD
jgi:SAM-dependent methyltransferase